MKDDTATPDDNSQPRVALLATMAFSILILLLHFPFDGYVTESSYTVPSFTACPKGDPKTLLRELGAEQFNKAISACQDKIVTNELPFTEWRSTGAAVYWLASPIHALATIFAILVIGLSWFFLLDQDTAPPTRKTPCRPSLTMKSISVLNSYAAKLKTCAQPRARSKVSVRPTHLPDHDTKGDGVHLI